MKPKSTLRSFLCIASSALLTITYAQATTFTWSNLDNATPVTNGNWSGGESWSAAPVSAADTTLVFGYSFGSNSTTETNTLTNDIANPFLLNVLTLGINTPGAGNGSQIALINIAGTPLEFVSNGGTTPQVNLSQNRSNGQVVSFDVQTNLVLTNNTLFTGNGTANFTVSGAISGAGSFTKSGSSALTLSGSTFSTGGLLMDGGTLTMSAGFSSGTGGLVMNAGTLTMSGDISSSVGGLDMNGGTWILSGTNNTYTGGSTIDGGTLVFRNTGAKSASGTHAFAAGTTLGLGVGGSGFFDATDITSAFAGGVMSTNLSNVTVTDTTNVGTDTTAGNFAHSADIPGGSPNNKGLTKLGTNTLTLSGNNSYTGATTIVAGTLSIATIANAGSSSVIGAFATAGAGGLLLQGGSLTYTGATATTNRGFTLDAAGTITVSTAGATLTMGNATINGGSLTVTGGTGSSLALGTVTQNAALSFGTSNRPISIQSIILGSGGSSLSPATNSLVTVGDITGTNQNYQIGGASGTITGNIALGTGNLTKAGTGTWTLSGLSSYSGTTTLNGNSAVIINSIKDVGAGNSSLGAPTDSTKGTIAFNGGTLRYIGTGDSTDRVINLGGSVALDMSGTNTLTFTSAFTSTNGSKTLTLTGSTAGIGELQGAIVNGGTGSNAVTKTGSGTWILSGDSNTPALGYTGATTVSAGTLLVNGSLKAGSAVTVTAGTLGGTGTINGTVTIGNSTGSADAILAPGASIDSLNTGSLTFLSDGSYAVELNGSSVTTDVTNVTGTVAIDAATTLTVDVAGTLSGSQQYIIVANDDVDAVTGTFFNLAQGAVVGTFGGTELKISYTGGDGNDIVLYTESTGSSAYDTWKAANAPGSNPDDDTDGDGVTNAVEFVLGGTSATNDLDKLPLTATDGTHMTFTFKRKQSSIDPKTSLAIEVGTDLAIWNTSPSPYTVPDGAIAGPPVKVEKGVPVDYDTITLTVAQDSATKFARLKVIITP